MAAEKMSHIGAQTCANPQITCCYFGAEKRADVSIGETQKVMPCVQFLTPALLPPTRHCHGLLAFAGVPTTLGSMAESCCHAKRHAWTAAVRQQLASRGCSKPPNTARRHAAALYSAAAGCPFCCNVLLNTWPGQLCWQLRSACSAKLGLSCMAVPGGGAAGAPSAPHPPAVHPL